MLGVWCAAHQDVEDAIVQTCLALSSQIFDNIGNHPALAAGTVALLRGCDPKEVIDRAPHDLNI